MDQKVTDFFPFHSDVNTAGKFIYLNDQQSMSGQFMFNLMLEKYIREKRTVHLISVAHKRHHYDSVLRKLSIDLMKLEAEDMIKIHYINMPPSNHPKKTYDEDVDPSNLFISVSTPVVSSEAVATTFISTPQDQARRILSEIATLSLDVHSNRVVMVDDLIALDVILKNEDFTALSFVYDCQALLSFKKIHSLVLYSNDPESTSHSSGSAAVEAFHGLTAEEDNNGGCLSSSQALPEVCKYRSDITVVASKLDSGYSADVHGQLLVTTRNGSLSTKDAQGTPGVGDRNGCGWCPHQQRLLFKTSDAGIKCALH